MTIIRWAAMVWCVVCMAMPASALDYRAGITAGTAFLYGDNATSDTGATIGLSYEMNVAPFLNIGIRTSYLHTAGVSEITDLSSIFYGSHEYDTTFLTGSIAARLFIPNHRVLPYLTLGIGESLWVPGKNDSIDTLPMKRKVSWSASPFVSLGAGISIPLGQHLLLDIGAESSFFFTDELDNVDGGYVSGGSDSNDYLMTLGLAFIYRFGDAPASRGTSIPPRDISRPEESVTPTTRPDEPVFTPPAQEEQELPAQQPVTTPPETDTSLTVPETIDRTETDAAAPDTTATELIEPMLPPVPVEEPEEIPAPRQSQPRRTPNRSYLVHVASFPTTAEADTQAAVLRNAGYRTRIDSVDRGDIGIWYRVHVGPYPTRSEAEQTADRLIQSGLSDYAAVIEEEQ